MLPQQSWATPWGLRLSSLRPSHSWLSLQRQLIKFRLSKDLQSRQLTYPATFSQLSGRSSDGQSKAAVGWLNWATSLQPHPMALQLGPAMTLPLSSTSTACISSKVTGYDWIHPNKFDHPMKESFHRSGEIEPRLACTGVELQSSNPKTDNPSLSALLQKTKSSYVPPFTAGICLLIFYVILCNKVVGLWWFQCKPARIWKKNILSRTGKKPRMT